MDAYVITAASDGLKLVLILSGPPVIAALVVGLMVSLLQATTQVQEQTLTFVPKLVAIILVLMLMGPLGMNELQKYTVDLFTNYMGYFK